MRAQGEGRGREVQDTGGRQQRDCRGPEARIPGTLRGWTDQQGARRVGCGKGESTGPVAKSRSEMPSRGGCLRARSRTWRLISPREEIDVPPTDGPPFGQGCREAKRRRVAVPGDMGCGAAMVSRSPTLKRGEGRRMVAMRGVRHTCHIAATAPGGGDWRLYRRQWTTKSIRASQGDKSN
jgi:hypothetical protein